MRLIFGPDKILNKKSEPFYDNEFGEKAELLAQSMLKIMRRFGGVGLAAIQLGLPKRILVGEADGKEFVLINPEIKKFSEEKVSINEGCLSFPVQAYKISRPSEIFVLFQDTDGNSVEQTFDGLAARIIQHEIDHLNGITILDKLSSFKRSLYIKKMKKRLRLYNKTKKDLGNLNVAR